ncbi:MAG: hypothetical protein EOO85_25330 [Pedobacter sp.]|nr:MAG: hypothetical protein EOO85_25330 [Pedobacter sp.]
MSTSITTQNWTPSQIFILRLVFIFFVILSIPYDLHLFRSLSSGFFSFENLFQIATYRTSFIPESLYAGIHLEGYLNWLIALVLAILGAYLWDKSRYGKLQADHDQLYYWLRVLLRYRLALAVIITGIAKLVPIQIPDPTLSDLHEVGSEALNISSTLL